MVLFLCGASSILFNANPLLRFDGYYLFCDHSRSAQSRRAEPGVLDASGPESLGSADRTEAPATTPRERKWLLLYAPASFVYRIVRCRSR